MSSERHSRGQKANQSVLPVGDTLCAIAALLPTLIAKVVILPQS